MKARDWLWVICIVLGIKLLFAFSGRMAASPQVLAQRSAAPLSSASVTQARKYVPLTEGFERIELQHGARIDVPIQWEPVPEALTSAARTSANAMLANEGIASSTGRTRLLLAYTSRPKSTYASVRVKRIEPVEITPGELIAASDAEIASVAPALVEMMSVPMAKNGQELLPGATTTREFVSGFPALVFRYRRNGDGGPVSVEQIKIMTASGEIAVTLSYRESERMLWASVIENIRRSIVVEPGT